MTTNTQDRVTKIADFIAACRAELAPASDGGSTRELSRENYERLESLVKTVWGDEANIVPDFSQLNGVLDALEDLEEHDTDADRARAIMDVKDAAVEQTRAIMDAIEPTEHHAETHVPKSEIVAGQPLPSGDQNCVQNLRAELGARIEHVDDHDLALAWREFGRSGHATSDYGEFVENWLPEAPRASLSPQKPRAPAKTAAKRPEPAKKTAASKRPATPTAKKPEPARLSPVRKSTTPQSTREEIASHLHALGDPNVEPIDVLRAGLCLVALDPIVYAARSRELVNDLIGQARAGVALVTGNAERLGVRFHDEPVVQSTDRALWPSARLEQLSANVRVHVEHALEDGARALEKARREIADVARVREELAEKSRRIAELQEQVQSLTSTVTQRALEANTLVASYVDQDIFVVAQIDPTTQRPLKYAVVEDTDELLRITSARELGAASKFGSWEGANDVRLRLARSRRDAARGGVVGSDRPIISVMRLSVRAIDVEDVL